MEQTHSEPTVGYVPRGVEYHPQVVCHLQGLWANPVTQKLNECRNEYHSYSQQRKLMGSSAQNSSSAHWCRRPVKFNKVPEVRKVPEKVWEALVQSQVRFSSVPEKIPEKVPEKVPGSLGAKPSQVQQGSGEGSRKGSGEGREAFGGEPGQVQQGSGEG